MTTLKAYRNSANGWETHAAFHWLKNRPGGLGGSAPQWIDAAGGETKTFERGAE